MADYTRLGEALLQSHLPVLLEPCVSISLLPLTADSRLC